MKSPLIVPFFIISLISFSGIAAQSQFSGWVASFHSFKTGKQTSIHADVQMRSSDKIKELQTLLLRSGLNFHLNKKITVTTGYAFIRNRKLLANQVAHTPEHRIWQQFLYSHKIKTIRLSHRFRIEQRFISRTRVSGNPVGEKGYANRFRYFTRNILPFQNAATFDKGIFAALQNEVFLNFGNTDDVNGKIFDQNRLYGAIGYRISPKHDLEIGYMNQYVSGKGDQFTNNHIIQLAGYFRL
ncbi:MAG TPA: DUF2490 domain-containing protein [Chitinophagaceae bacterium]|nr:DUF2490 domain-containing protein [Chitinophagaceae bacterium]